MHFTIADDVRGRGISFNTACECDFDQFCINFILGNQIFQPLNVLLLKTIILVGNANVGPLQCILCETQVQTSVL